jgi:Leucine-rich repeat (LRR) protein
MVCLDNCGNGGNQAVEYLAQLKLEQEIRNENEPDIGEKLKNNVDYILINHMNVTDISHLKGFKFTELDLSSNDISDISDIYDVDLCCETMAHDPLENYAADFTGAA